MVVNNCLTEMTLELNRALCKLINGHLDKHSCLLKKKWEHERAVHITVVNEKPMTQSKNRRFVKLICVCIIMVHGDSKLTMKQNCNKTVLIFENNLAGNSK